MTEEFDFDVSNWISLLDPTEGSANTRIWAPAVAPAAATLSKNDALRGAFETAEALLNADEETRVAKAKELRGQGFSVIAAKLVEDLVPDSRAASLIYGQALRTVLDPDRRIAIAEYLCKFHREPAFLVLLANALSDGLRYEEADRVIDELETRFPDRPALLRHRTLTLLRRGRFQAAHEQAVAVAERYPEHGIASSDRLRTSLELGHSLAEEQVDISSGETPINLLRTVADHHLALGNTADCVALRQRIADMSGETTDLFGLLNARFANGDFEEAAEECEVLKERFPGYGNFRRKAGQVAERRGDYDAMLANFGELLALEPIDEVARAAIARALIYLKRPDDAIVWLNACQRPSDATIWTDSMRAFLYARTGDDAKAREALADAYRRCDAVMSAYRTGQANDPCDAYLLDDLHVSHPSANAAQIFRNFNQWLGRIARGSISLIGNSPKILDSGYGSAIDDSDTIIRLNDFVVKGHEAVLGRRTDYWFSSANWQASPDHEATACARKLLMQPNAQHFPDIPEFTSGRLGITIDPADTAYLPPCVKMMSERTAYATPSTGFRMIQVLEFLIQRPYSAFGFDFFESGEMHYFDTGETHLQVGEVHAVQFERDFVNQLLVPFSPYANFV